MKVFRFWRVCVICAALGLSSIAGAQAYKTVDYPGATATFLLGGPNPEGTSVGNYVDIAGVFHGFTLDSQGGFTSFDPPGSTSTTPNFISPEGVIVGAYNDAAGVSHGFVLSGGQYTTVDFPNAAGTALTGLTPSGEMSGFLCPDPGCATNANHSFIVTKAGVFTRFDPPGAVNSEAAAITPTGEVVGAYIDGHGVEHGYVFSLGTFSTTDFPGATFTFNGGVNPQGGIVGAYRNGSVQHCFLLNHGVFTNIDPPGSAVSDATGISPGGIIVGIFVDSAGGIHGFIRMP